jgi:hypothetical protein
MGLTVKAGSSGTKFKQVDPGMHLARCYRVIDLGTQSTMWDKMPKYKKKIRLQFEVHGEDSQGQPLLTDKGVPLSTSKDFTASLHEKSALRKELENWRSRAFTQDELDGFQLKNVLGAWAMISVVNEKGRDGNYYTNISSINPVPTSIKKNGLPEGVNELKLFDIDNPDMEMLESFGEKLQSKIKSTPEWTEKHGGQESVSPVNSKSSFADMEEDIPF